MLLLCIVVVVIRCSGCVTGADVVDMMVWSQRFVVVINIVVVVVVVRI